MPKPNLAGPLGLLRGWECPRIAGGWPRMLGNQTLILPDPYVRIYVVWDTRLVLVPQYRPLTPHLTE
jgi:hypothetical protein